MIRIAIRLALAAALGTLLAPLGSSAQRAGKVYRIGYLSFLECPIRPEFSVPFRQGLREVGYVEGQNIVIECRGALGVADRLPGLADELVRLKVDLLVAPNTPSALAAKQATKTIPIVMLYVGDPIGSGLVTSFARPGGNVTGLSVFGPDMVQKALEVLKEAAPSVSRVAVWIDPANPGHTQPDPQLDAAAKILGVRLNRVDARAAANLDAAFAAALKQREEALFVYPGSLPISEIQRIAQFAIKNRLPTTAISPNYVRAGMLMSYGPSIPDMYRRAGTHIDKILKGAKPADLPVEQPTKIELVINLGTAKAIGLTIPQSLLQRADEVIQ
jgi:putative ABC transport system substrate-binding protein